MESWNIASRAKSHEEPQPWGTSAYQLRHTTRYIWEPTQISVFNSLILYHLALLVTRSIYGSLLKLKVQFHNLLQVATLIPCRLAAPMPLFPWHVILFFQISCDRNLEGATPWSMMLIIDHSYLIRDHNASGRCADDPTQFISAFGFDHVKSRNRDISTVDSMIKSCYQHIFLNLVSL